MSIGHPNPAKALSQQQQLLMTFENEHDGLTAQEAAERCELWERPDCQYQKRCGELELQGHIQRNFLMKANGQPVLEQRLSPHGNHRMVYRLTDRGYREIQQLKKFLAEHQLSLPFTNGEDKTAN